jgi:hypothetical protein
MSEVALKRIIAELDGLESEELERLSAIVQRRLARPSEDERRRAFHDALQAAGLVRHFNVPATRARPECLPIEVIGAPVSETIIRERR